MTSLRRASPAEATGLQRAPVDRQTLMAAAEIVEDVRSGGEASLREQSVRLGDLGERDPILITADQLEVSYRQLHPEHRGVLDRASARIEGFAREQLESLEDVDVEVEGGRAGHTWMPVGSAGAYAPGGRHPLPSSVLMTAIPARVAGVERVWVASPRPAPVTLAAAWVAGADGLLAVGGAQAVAAMAFGTVSPACDLIVGPGNRWVTAAKKHLYGEVGIDGLAGPSEIVVIADETAIAERVAADLLGQAEHDTDAIPSLITTSAELADRVDAELGRQLSDLPTAEVAGRALENGVTVVVDNLAEATRVSDAIAPEHLALHVDDPEALREDLRFYGSLFVGSVTAEAFADYGAGPNHVLPTGGGARFQSGLSVMTFLRSPTWLRLDDPSALAGDTALFARLEGLEGHARSALQREQ